MTAIDIDQHGAVRHVIINRPERRNSLRPADLDDLLAALDAAANDDSVRCVVLGGRGGSLSSGGDLTEGVATDAASADGLLREYHRLVRQLIDMPVPVVTVLEGVVVGAAAALVFGCDICVTAPDSRIVLPAVVRGFVPDAGTTFFLARTLGPARTKALLLGAGSITASQAVEWGLVAEAATDPWAAAGVWAQRLSGGPAITTRWTRRLVDHAAFDGLHASLEMEREAMVAAFGTGEPVEGMAAFRERRDPVFT